uniref:(California timema) hypothetical protein n=1 Tax=Timema californicum TaxID=61474 RepID=A0A7R9JDK5_TIMCA|nr:unnamed protein product [Timema californicum]
MEEILAKLLVADSAIIQQGTQELREAFKNVDVIPALCNVIGVSQNPQIRQYAAVLLRKRLNKAKHWTKLSINVRNGIKEGILQALINEPEKFVKNAIAQFIGTIVKHEFPNKTWPEVLQFIQQMINSDNMTDKELGMYTLSMITEISSDQFLPHASSLVYMLANTLNQLENLSSPLSYYTLLTMIHIVPLVEGDQALANLFTQLMPRVMEAVRALVQTDEDKAVEVMELFDDLVESVISVIVPHIKPLVEMCLMFAANKDLGDPIRVKALGFIGWIARSKKKCRLEQLCVLESRGGIHAYDYIFQAIVKHKLVQPIVDVLFLLMSVPPDNEEMEEYFIDDESSTPMTCATQTLDILALHLPPDKLFQPLLQYVEPSLQGDDVYKQKASYLTMAVLAEGCAEHIRTKYLESFLQCICKGIRAPIGVVRNAALFALGQFSEHLQPEISHYASELLPVLFDYLSQLCSQLQNNGKEPPGVDRMFYALEMFCENLGDELLPYLPTLMERIFTALSPTNSVHLRELALSAVGATANAAKEGMVPYFPRVIEYLKTYLAHDQTDETMCLQVQAVDTLGVLARTVGSETFLPLAKESIQLGLKLVSGTDDPDLRKSVYGLFGSISTVLKEDMSSVLPTIIDLMLGSLRSSDGIVAHFKEEENNAFPVYDDLSDTPDEEDIENESEGEEEDEDITGIPAFLPYLEKCFEEVFKLITYPQDEIRKAVLDTLLQFCISFSKITTDEGKIALLKALALLIPKCSELIRMDEERGVVMAALDVYCDLLTEVKRPVLEGEGHRDAIINCIKDVMTYKTECQDKEDEGSDDPEAEQDEMLIECAGNIKKQCTVSQRSFSVGTLSECMEPLGPRVAQFVPQLLPLFLQLAKDESDEVRNNAIFGVGEMVLHGKEALYPYFPEILQALSAAVSKEANPSALDNICGALARMLITNVSGVPMDHGISRDCLCKEFSNLVGTPCTVSSVAAGQSLPWILTKGAVVSNGFTVFLTSRRDMPELCSISTPSDKQTRHAGAVFHLNTLTIRQDSRCHNHSVVFPVFVNYLPLRQDFDENKAVFRCLLHLYQMGHPLLQKFLSPLVRASLVVINCQQGDKETLELVSNFISMVRRDFAEEFNKIVSDLPAELTPVVQQLFSS